MSSKWNVMFVTTSLFAMGACLDAAPATEGVDPGADAPVEYLFGLSEAELLSIHPVVSEQHDQASWLAFNRAPFECLRYGDLCRMVGATAAEDITRYALTAALAGADRTTIVAEMDRRTELARAALVEPPQRANLRASEVGTINYPCNNHRLRTETFKVNPVVGSRYGQVQCSHQADLGSGIWGGSQTADELVAYVEIVGTGEDASASQTDVHKITSPKVFPGANQTVRGKCTGTHGGDTMFRTISID